MKQGSIAKSDYPRIFFANYILVEIGNICSAIGKNHFLFHVEHKKT